MNQPQKKRVMRQGLIGLAVSALILTGLACTFSLGENGKPPDETEIARSVEETLRAETHSTEPSVPTDETGAPAIESPQPDINATIQAQQATLDAQTTELAKPKATEPSNLPVESNTPEATAPLASSQPISLVNMKSSTLRQAPGCGEDRNGPPCWFGRGAELGMITMKPIFINPAWQNPYLTFSHRYFFVHNATIYARVGGSIEVLWSFPSGQSSAWIPFKVDLSKYKGKEIDLEFIVSGTAGTLYNAGQRNDWSIRDPQIVPNYDL